VLANLRQLWDKTSRAGRVGFMAGAVTIVAALAYFGYAVLRPDYAVLFTDLDPQDTAAIANELERLKIPYRVGANEASVLVEKANVHTSRLKLMGNGVNLRGGVGFEIFNNTDFGMTEFAQKINYQRALQGELARTIQALDEVKVARVHLVMPESGLFRKSNQKPKASITLALKERRVLQAEQVVGIQRLVAASVPEISADAVTILDQRGVALTRPAESETPDNGMASRVTAKQEIEADLTRKAVAVLDKAFGPGRAIVSVDVTVSHDETKVTQEEVLPLNQRGKEPTGVVVRRRVMTQDRPAYTMEAGLDGGYDAPAQISSTSEVEYQSGRRVEQTISQPGSIRRVSVGVLLPHALEPSKLDEIRQVLAMGLGLNVERGDQIAISSIDQFTRFEQREATVETPPVPSPIEQTVSPPRERAVSNWLRDYLPTWFGASPELTASLLLGGLSLIALLGLLLRSLPRKRTRLAHREREQLLLSMRQWLHADNQPVEHGEKP
jgi:flagellar M-ring protein FliF